jgi:hypothetical protein
VHILVPTDGQTLTTPELGTFHLSGEVIEDGVLASLELQVTRLDTGTTGRAPLTPTSPSSGNPNYTFNKDPANNDPACCLALGANRITVRATDGAGNVGESSITVVRAEVPLDITIAGYEVTQAVAYAKFGGLLQSCLDTAAGGGPGGQACTPDLSNYPLPWIRGKDTVVRVYPKVLGTNSPIGNVSAMLHVRHGDTLVKTLQPMNTLGSTATINIQPTSTSTDLRRCLTASWNFLLAAADTDTDQLNLNIVVNPVGAGHITECMTVQCANNNNLRLVVPFKQPKSEKIRTVKIDVVEMDGTITRVSADEAEKVGRYIGQTYPLRVTFEEGGAHGYNRGELIGESATPLGITGAFIKSERFSFTGGLIGSIIGMFYPRGGRTLDELISIAECYATPEPDYYTLGLSPIADDQTAGLGFPPVHFFYEVPIFGWRIDLLTMDCHEAWASVSNPDGPGRAAQENSHNLEVGPGHYSQDHREQNLGIVTTIVNWVLSPIQTLLNFIDPIFHGVQFDLPIRSEPDDQHGNIREFGLDMTGNLAPSPTPVSVWLLLLLLVSGAS